MSDRPKDEEELQRLEAIGIIRASRFVRKCAQSHKKVSIDTIFEIHKEVFKNAWLDIAGKIRDVEIKITDSRHLPPHHSLVPGLVKKTSEELNERLLKLKSIESYLLENKDLTEEDLNMIDQIIETAAWLHHKITYIHPFREGNGRTARLSANLILECHGLVGISIKVERENKNKYRQALAQADKMNDLEPLKNLIYEGIIDRLNDIPMFFDKSQH